VIDVSDPARPSLLGSLDTPGSALDLELVGNLVYLADRSGLRVIDVSNPSAPVEVGSFVTPTESWCVDVVGNIA
jgi:hypothetical protein